MKFKIALSYADDKPGNDEVFWESYDENIEDPQAWAEKTIAWFNDTLRPNERPRKLLEVVVEDEDNGKFHDWDKDITGMSKPFRGDIVDVMVCRKCGITGKRHGFSSHVKIDSKFRKKAFQRCDTAQEEMAKQRR